MPHAWALDAVYGRGSSFRNPFRRGIPRRHICSQSVTETSHEKRTDGKGEMIACPAAPMTSSSSILALAASRDCGSPPRHRPPVRAAPPVRRGEPDSDRHRVRLLAGQGQPDHARDSAGRRPWRVRTDCGRPRDPTRPMILGLAHEPVHPGPSRRADDTRPPATRHVSHVS